MNLLERTYNDELSLLQEREEEVLFKFYGLYDHEGIIADRQKLSDLLYDSGEDISNVKKVMNVFIETAQNTVKHGLKRDGYTDVYFILSRAKGKYRFVSGNEVTSEAQENVARYMEWVLSMTIEEFKTRFLKILVRAKFTEVGTGGLGLLLMAKSGNVLSYNTVSSNSLPSNGHGEEEHIYRFEVNIP